MGGSVNAPDVLSSSSDTNKASLRSYGNTTTDYALATRILGTRNYNSFSIRNTGHPEWSSGSSATDPRLRGTGTNTLTFVDKGSSGRASSARPPG